MVLKSLMRHWICQLLCSQLLRKRLCQAEQLNLKLINALDYKCLNLSKPNLWLKRSTRLLITIILFACSKVVSVTCLAHRLILIQIFDIIFCLNCFHYLIKNVLYKNERDFFSSQANLLNLLTSVRQYL